LAAAAYKNRCARDRYSMNGGNKGFSLCSYRADANSGRLGSNTNIADIDIVTASSEC
jgi:hypothetical protein